MFTFITTHQRSCGKVMFSYMSVRQSVCPQGGPIWQLPVRMMHWTSLCSPPLPHPRHGTSLDRDLHLLVICAGHHWISVPTCSLQPPLPPPLALHLVTIGTHTVSASEQCASYWNAFLLKRNWHYITDICYIVCDYIQANRIAIFAINWYQFNKVIHP